MAYFILKRLLSTVLILLLVAVFVFTLLYFAPGDPAVAIAGPTATSAQIDEVRRSLGLDGSYPARFLGWLIQAAQGDFGTSIFTREPVTTLIFQRLEPTVALTLLTMLFAVPIALPLGVLAAWNAGGATDRLLMGGAVLGFSVPVFVIGYVLAWVFGLQLRWLPVQGYVPLDQGVGPWLRTLVLPTITLGVAYVALLARITRATMIEALQQDYVRTARAKGVPWRKVLFLHALKNASIPIVTVVGLGVGLLIGGAVVTESVFAIPGLGRLTVDAVLRRDYPVIQAIVLLFSVFYVVINLLVDLVYALLDPRIRY